MAVSEVNLDALGEIINIGVGRAAASLSQMLGTRIVLSVPNVKLVSPQQLDAGGTSHDAGTSVKQSFEGEVEGNKLSGNALLLFPKASGLKLAQILGGYNESEELSELELSGILSEVGNIVLNGVLGSLGNLIESQLDYTVPDFYVDRRLVELVDLDPTDSETLLIADTQFDVDSRNISGSVVIAFELGSLDSLLSKLAKLEG